MIVLGLDPSLTATGWGVVRADGTRLAFIACGTIKTSPGADMSVRLGHLYGAVASVIADCRPHAAAAEEVFSNQNPKSTLKLGQARGAVLAAAGAAGLAVAEYAPRLVKKSLVGTGAADKQQVAAMVARLLPGAKPDSLDASDALAVAIHHAGQARYAAKVMHA